MAATMPRRSIRLGSKRTVARSVARLTAASATPSERPRNRSMRETQEAQVIPTTGSESSVRGVVDEVFTFGFRILQGSIQPASPSRAAAPLASRATLTAA
jgi:hypothetical protein